MTIRPITPQDQQRRLRLRVAAKLMAAVAVFACCYVLMAGLWSSGGDAESIPTLQLAIGDLQPGETRLLSWEGRPVLLYRRQDQDFVTLRTVDERLVDPRSVKSTQPEGLDNDFRSFAPELFVAIALGTDLGCSIRYLPAEEAAFQGRAWQGGFVDSCRKARYDLAGRIYRSQYADKNLAVPSYTLKGDSLILGR